METILVIAVLIGVGLVLNWLRNSFWRAANRKVLLRGQHRRGRELVTDAITAESEHEPETLRERVISEVAAPTEPKNAVYPTIYLAEQTPQMLTFVCGTRMQTVFTALVAIQEVGDGSRLHFSVPSWTESDGIVAQLSQLEELKEQVFAAAA